VIHACEAPHTLGSEDNERTERCRMQAQPCNRFMRERFTGDRYDSGWRAGAIPEFRTRW
jgi:hypothetical protein